MNWRDPIVKVLEGRIPPSIQNELERPLIQRVRLVIPRDEWEALKEETFARLDAAIWFNQNPTIRVYAEDLSFDYSIPLKLEKQ